MRIASSLTRDFSSFVAGVFRVVAFFRGELALFGCGFRSISIQCRPIGRRLLFVASFCFLCHGLNSYRFTRPS